jgi:hypothetical protein
MHLWILAKILTLQEGNWTTRYTTGNLLLRQPLYTAFAPTTIKRYVDYQASRRVFYYK